MKQTLVTGANGHVGNNICRLLVERGEPVRAMIRASADPAPLQGLGVDVVHGDILDPQAVNAAAEGCGRMSGRSMYSCEKSGARCPRLGSGMKARLSTGAGADPPMSQMLSPPPAWATGGSAASTSCTSTATR